MWCAARVVPALALLTVAGELDARRAAPWGAAVLRATGPIDQDARPDFAGRWLLDLQATTVSGGGRGDAGGNASGGGGRGGGGTGLGAPADELSIQQSDTMLVVEEQRETATNTIRYALDGKRLRNQMAVGRGETADASYSSRWAGARLETWITRRISARGNDTQIRYHELLYLSSDGALVVETTVAGRPAGRKAVYRKAS